MMGGYSGAKQLLHGRQEVEESSAEKGKGTLEHSQGLLLQLGSDSVLS